MNRRNWCQGDSLIEIKACAKVLRLEGPESLKKAIVWSAESEGVEGIGGARGQVGLNLTCHCLKIE